MGEIISIFHFLLNVHSLLNKQSLAILLMLSVRCSEKPTEMQNSYHTECQTKDKGGRKRWHRLRARERKTSEMTHEWRDADVEEG